MANTPDSFSSQQESAPLLPGAPGVEGQILAILAQEVTSIAHSVDPTYSQLLNALLNHPRPQVRSRVWEFILSQGENSISTTLALFETMLRGLTPEQQIALMPQVGRVFAHHVFEVVSDSLDRGLKNTPQGVQFLTWFNYIAQLLAQGKIALEDVRLDVLRTNTPIDTEIGHILAARIPPEFAMPAEMRQAIENISLPILLKTNLAGVDALHRRVTKLDEAGGLNEFILNALAARYAAVSNLISPASGYANATIGEAITLREDAILIKVTMGILIQGLAQIDPDLRQFVADYTRHIQGAIEASAKLIGLWNDMGSKLLRLDRAKAAAAMRQLQTAYPTANIRQVLAPPAYLEATRGASTSELMQLRSLLKPQKFDWTLTAQLLKDATNGEHNLLMDLHGPQDTPQADWAHRIDLLDELIQLAQYVERYLGDLLRYMPPEIATIIRNATVFHAHLYQGHDYYDRVSGVDQLPIVQGHYTEADDALLGLVNFEG